MIRELQDRIHDYFRQKDLFTSEEAEILRLLESEKEYYQVTAAVSTEDFREQGFDISTITHEMMIEYADRI